MRPNTIIILDLPVMVVLVVVVPVVELRTGVTVVKEVRVHQVRDTTVPDQVIIGTPVVVGVPVRRGMGEMVVVVVVTLYGETVVMD